MIHEDFRYTAVMRNVSRTGAFIEGLLNVPVGTQLVLDLGEGQLAIATVRRSLHASIGVEFESPLIYDRNDNLCTRYRVSPKDIAAAGFGHKSGDAGARDAGPRITGVGDDGAEAGKAERTRPEFMQVEVVFGSNRAA